MINFLLETIQLVYWVFFKPLTLKKYLHDLAPQLPHNFNWWQARHTIKNHSPLFYLFKKVVFLHLLVILYFLAILFVQYWFTKTLVIPWSIILLWGIVLLSGVYLNASTGIIISVFGSLSIAVMSQGLLVTLLIASIILGFSFSAYTVISGIPKSFFLFSIFLISFYILINNFLVDINLSFWFDFTGLLIGLLLLLALFGLVLGGLIMIFAGGELGAVEMGNSIITYSVATMTVMVLMAQMVNTLETRITFYESLPIGVILVSFSSIVLFIISSLRIFFYTIEVVVLMFLIFLSKLNLIKSCSYWVMFLPYHFDEVIFFPLWGINRFVRKLAKQNRHMALGECDILLNSFAQQYQGYLALRDITVDALLEARNLSELANIRDQIDWIPESTNSLQQISTDLAEFYPRLLEVSHEIFVTYQGGNLIINRQGKRHANELLHRLQKTLISQSSSSKKRWEPVIQHWQSIIKEWDVTGASKQIITLKEGVLAKTSIGIPFVGVENPYEIFTPVNSRRAQLFKGRRILRDQVVQAFRESSRPAIMLTGTRRMGKTSFLIHLEHLLPTNTLLAYVDLQRGSATANDGQLLYELARTLYRAVQPHHPLAEPAKELFRTSDPFVAFDDWWEEQCAPHLGEQTILLAIDEFEKAGEALLAGRLTSRIQDFLRHLIQHQSHITLLLAGVQNLDELGAGWSSYLINVLTLSMDYLTPSEAEELIREPDPEAHFGLTYEDDIVAEIIAFTHRQPALLQLLCACIVEEVNARGVVHADGDILAGAIIRAYERGNNYFRNVWDEMVGPAGYGLARQLAASKDVPVRLAGLAGEEATALARMVRLRVVTALPEGYVVEIPMIGRWIREQASE